MKVKEFKDVTVLTSEGGDLKNILLDGKPIFTEEALEQLESFRVPSSRMQVDTGADVINCVTFELGIFFNELNFKEEKQ